MIVFPPSSASEEVQALQSTMARQEYGRGLQPEGTNSQGEPNGDGLQPNSFQPRSNGLQPKSDGLPTMASTHLKSRIHHGGWLSLHTATGLMNQAYYWTDRLAGVVGREVRSYQKAHRVTLPELPIARDGHLLVH